MSNKYFKILDDKFTIHRFKPDTDVPANIFKSKFYWIGKTDDELSIICASETKLNSPISDINWSIIKIVAKLSFDMIGIIADISNALKNEGISIIALSTFDTDYIMLKTEKLMEAKKALENIGYNIIN